MDNPEIMKFDSNADPVKQNTEQQYSDLSAIKEEANKVKYDTDAKMSALNKIAQFQTNPDKLGFYDLLRESVGNQFLAPFVDYMAKNLAQDEAAQKQLYLSAMLSEKRAERDLDRQKNLSEYQLRRQAEMQDALTDRELKKQARTDLSKWRPIARSPKVVSDVSKLIEKGMSFDEARAALAEETVNEYNPETGAFDEKTAYVDPFDTDKGWTMKVTNPTYDPTTGTMISGQKILYNPYTGESRIATMEGAEVPKGSIRTPAKKTGKVAKPKGPGI